MLQTVLACCTPHTGPAAAVLSEGYTQLVDEKTFLPLKQELSDLLVAEPIFLSLPTP